MNWLIPLTVCAFCALAGFFAGWQWRATAHPEASEGLTYRKPAGSHAAVVVTLSGGGGGGSGGSIDGQTRGQGGQGA